MAPQSFEVLCQQARQAIAERDWEKARQSYLQALGLKSDVPDIHQGLATVCFQLRDLTSAAYHFKEVTRLDPHRAGAFINLGAVYNLMDQLDDAVNALRRGIQLDSQRAEGYYNLGLVYRRKGQVDLAIHAYREALRINPRMADASYNLANLYLDKEQFSQAITHYKQALQIRPNWDKALQGLANADEALQEASADKVQQEQEAEAAQAPASKSSSPAIQVDPNRVVDPDIHGLLLNALHKATIESDNYGRHFFQLVEEEVEPVIKELSSCMISPDVSITVLDTCIQKFEDALTHIRSARENLQSSIAKVRTLGDKLVAEAS
jgi:tetratricopeptide (TPR) repeat protein